MNEPHVVYENTVDDQTWAVNVTRLKPYVGILTVTKMDTDEVIYQQNVGIAYDAAFGPDVDDVEAWQQIALNAIDKETS